MHSQNQISTSIVYFWAMEWATLETQQRVAMPCEEHRTPSFQVFVAKREFPFGFFKYEFLSAVV